MHKRTSVPPRFAGHEVGTRAASLAVPADITLQAGANGAPSTRPWLGATTPSKGSQRGYLLLPVVLVLIVIGAVALLLNREASMANNTIAGAAEAAQAEYLAQAGLHHALWQMEKNTCSGNISIPSTALGKHRYTAEGTSPATTSTQRFGPAADTFLKETTPDTNFGGGAQLRVEQEAGGSRRTLYRFDLSSIAPGTRLAAATLWLYVIANDAQGTVNIHPVNTAWDEGTATWNNLATHFDSQTFATIPPQASAHVWVPINLTALAQSWVNDASANHGIMLLATSDDVASRYPSKEYGSVGLQPYLEVVTSDVAVSPVSITAKGILDTGVLRMRSRTSAAVYQTASTVVLQPDATAGKDTLFREDAPSWNHGTTAWLWVQNSSGAGVDDHTLLQFDLGDIPLGSRVKKATLALYQYWGGLSGGKVGVHRVTSQWSEGEQDGAAGPGATWSHRDSESLWSTPGGDYDSAAVATTTISASTFAWYEWDLTALVDLWVSGTVPNQGLALVAESPGAEAAFASSDHTTTTWHPKLTITYACECGNACVAPQGSGSVLLVVDDPLNPSAIDTHKKALFEGWGYTVTFLDDDANQATFDNQMANHNVAYISETVSAATLGTKLSHTTKGVVSEEGRLNDELGIASGFLLPVGHRMHVIDTSHFITRPFASGPLQVNAVDMEALAAAGTPAGGLRVLAEGDGGLGLLVTLDTGADLYGGGSAPGRRVMLPIGREGNFNWNHVTNNGRLIVQRAIEWAAAEECTPQSVSMRVAAGGDDAEEQSNGGMTIDSSDLELTQVGIAPPQTIGIRFQDIPLPQGTPITSAYLDFTVDEVDSRATSLTIHGEASDHALQFTAVDENISGRPLTAAAVAWDNLPAWLIVGAVHSSPDVGPLVQEIVNRGGWSSGNAMAFILSGTGGRTAEAFEGSPTQAPLLRIDYCSDSPPGGGSCAIDPNGTYTEAEHYAPPLIDGTSPYQLVINSATAGANGGQYLESVGGTTQSSPTGQRADYPVTFPSDGTYYFWLRANDGSGGGDSTFWGVDGTMVGALTQSGSDWNWTSNLQLGANAAFITAGEHTINLWPREDGQQTDGFLISTNPSPLGLTNGSTVGIPAGATQIDPSHCGGCSGSYLDTFDSQDGNGDDGSLSWAGPWVEVGESDGLTAGDIRITNDISDYQLQIKDNDNGGEGVKRALDLTGAAAGANVKLKYRRNGLDSANDYVSIQASSTGINGPFNEIGRIDGGTTGTDGSYQNATYPLGSQYFTDQAAIRLISSPTLGSADIVWFDDIEVSCMP